MSNNELHLEPRVARLETSLETLTRNVSEIATTMRENALNTNNKLDALAISVTQAQAPRKTDWSVIISAVLLIMAIGSAVFWPLNQTTQDTKTRVEQYHESMVEHVKLDMHPVGWAKVQALERRYDTAQTEMVERDKQLDIKLQREYMLMNDTLKTEIKALDLRLQREFQLTYDRTLARLEKIEERNRHIDNLDREELRKWRLGELKKP